MSIARKIKTGLSKDFSHLTKRGSIGSLQLKNRMVVTAMGVNLAEPDGSCGEKIIAFHERQAKGGAGLIVMGVAGVAWPNGGNQPRQSTSMADCYPSLNRPHLGHASLGNRPSVNLLGDLLLEWKRGVRPLQLTSSLPAVILGPLKRHRHFLLTYGRPGSVPHACCIMGFAFVACSSVREASHFRVVSRSVESKM